MFPNDAEPKWENVIFEIKVNVMGSAQSTNHMARPAVLRHVSGGITILAGATALLSGWGLHSQSFANLGSDGLMAILAGSTVLAAASAYAMAYFTAKAGKFAPPMACTDAVGIRDCALNEHTIVSIVDHTGKVSMVNENFVASLGYEPDEIISQEPHLIYADQDVFADVRDHVTQRKVWKGEQVLKARDGRLLSFQTTVMPSFDENGNFSSSVAIRTDLTTTRAKAAYEGRNDVLESLRDMVFVYEPETYKVLYVNQAGRDQLGWTANENGTKSMLDTFSRFDLSVFQTYLAPLLKGETAQVRIQVMHDTGPVEVVTHFGKGIDGDPCLISVVRDVSERIKAEKLKLMSVSTVSHELRTPLTSIKGALRLLESGALGDLNAQSRKMIGIAHRNSDRLLSIVNDILDLEKIESGEISFTAQRVNLSDILNEAAEAHSSYGNDTGVNFVVEPCQEACSVEADPDRLMQVLANLMSNAAKFTPPDGTVRLSVKNKGDYWRVCVTDTGPGIPDSARSNIFDSFFQVKNEAKYSRPGTGLGLTICKRIIELHKGRISFETQIGKGTVFYFDLMKKEPLHLGKQDAA